MPRYDYRCLTCLTCLTCHTRFEVSRGLDEPELAVACPRGHETTSRVFTAVAVGGSATTAAPAGAGGCCGGGCCG